MNAQRLESILERLPEIRVIVAGDYFLDKELIIDPALATAPLETGIEEHQVVDVRYSPSAAGNVAANLRSLGVSVIALGVIGDDGQGYELARSLRQIGVDTSDLLLAPSFFTPSLIKPVVKQEGNANRELSRLGIINHTVLPPDFEQKVIARLRARAPTAHGLVAVDHVVKPNAGVITDQVRDEIARLAAAHAHTTFIADSHERIGLFRHVMIKPNEREATRAVHPSTNQPLRDEDLVNCAQDLQRRCGQAVFLTAGERGIFVLDQTAVVRIPAVPVAGPIDAIGAGDSALAGIAAALAAGASPAEAAQIGVLVASVTIQVIGATGTATRSQVRSAFAALQP